MGEADLFLVACRTGTERGTGDVLMVAIPREREGVSTERVYRKMASAFLPIGEMALDGVRVEADEVIAPPGAGFGAALGAIDVARVDIAAIAVGLAEAALDIALRHARDRAAFGGHILDLQGIRFALADIATDIAAGRLLYADAAAQLGTPEGTVAAAHAKRFCPDMALRAALECSEVLGAYGWLHDTPLPRLIANAPDAAVGRRHGGDPEGRDRARPRPARAGPLAPWPASSGSASTSSGATACWRPRRPGRRSWAW